MKEIDANIIEDENFIDIENNIKTNEFGEVVRETYPVDILQLTPYDSGSESPANYGVIAEYNDINVNAISIRQQKQAKDFVNKIEKFVLGFNDVELTESHKEYIRQVGELQFQNMSDLMELVQINKQMINNVVARINASQAEDYAIIASYNNLVNQHIKLSRELATVYKGIPTVMKKMKAEILSENESVDSSPAGLLTESYGETQFNNSKELIKKIHEKRAQNVQA